MKRKKKLTHKFEFGTDFQQLILQYTVTDKVQGPKALKLYDDTYFTLTHHAIIAWLLKKYFDRRHRIPTEPIIRESLRTYYASNRLAHELTDEDKELIDSAITNIYSKGVADSDEIMEKTRNFARYVNFKEELERIDINDFEAYSKAADKLKAAQNIGSEVEDDDGEWMVRGMPDRAHNRDDDQLVFPTPYKQFNSLLNGGGLSKGSMVMLVSQAKRFKTGALVNLALGYMRRKKKVLYIDLENGQKQLRTRGEQSLIEADQEEILKGMMDKRLLKLLRKYRRLGAELVIKRFPAYSTTSDYQVFVDRIYQKYGIKFDVVICDYPDLQGSTTGQKEETARINDAYIDNINFIEYNSYEVMFVASHVNREGGKRKASKYEQNDLAKCIDKIRHVTCAIGLQESPEEEEAGVSRWEIIEQRNGMRNGNMLFWMDIKKQKLKEFSREEVQKYRQQTSQSPAERDTEKAKEHRSKKKSDL